MPDRSPAKAGGQWLIAASALLLTACTSVELPAGAAPLDPVAFFTGETRGEGRLNVMLSPSKKITVQSRGERQSDGSLRLVQRITEGSKPPRVRTWIMEPDRDGDFAMTGTLTDAQGPVTITLEGPRASISYRTPDGVTIQQQLALQPDGRTILNHLEAYKFGMRVATLEEVIVKAP